MRERLIGISLLVALLIPTAVTARPDVTPGGAYVELTVLDEANRHGETEAWIVLREQADLSEASEIEDWGARGQFVYDALTDTARDTQAALRAELDQSDVAYQSFWIVNAILVTTDAATIEDLSERPDVAQILASRDYQLPEVMVSDVSAAPQDVEWGVEDVGAPAAWATYSVRGDGIVVGSMDTGVQFDHPALVNQYRGNLGVGGFDHNYNWFDPSRVCPDPNVPCDNNNHGTHTTGTMVGDDGGENQIGVAPGAKWIAAKGCETNDCTDFALLSSGQWMLAPTDLNGENPRPDLRPHIVNNSWGTGPGDGFYQHVVDAWVAAGIFPVFSIGNAGPSCGSAGSPGDYLNAYAVGAYASNGAIAGFSSRGASRFGGEIKPNIAAPGVVVRSSVPGDDYAALNGTSMAAPHVSGAVALMWSAQPDMIGDIAFTRYVLDRTAIDVEALQCGGTIEDNNVSGEGRLDAAAAVAMSMDANLPPRVEAGGPYTGDEGSPIAIAGTVTDPENDPLTTTWTITDGAPCSIEDPTELETTVTCTDNGDFVVTLTASDGESALPGTDSASLSVENLPPEIEQTFTNGPVMQGSPAEVTVVASDPGSSDELSYEFNCDEDDSYEIGPQSSNSASCALDPSRVVTTIFVRVSDDDGASVTDSVEVGQELAFCGKRSTGQLTYPLANGSCATGSEKLVLPQLDPVAICIDGYTGELTWAPRGNCSSKVHRLHLVPDNGPLAFCRHAYTGKLRYTASGACSSVERTGVIPG